MSTSEVTSAVATYEFTPGSAHWWWSDEMFRLHGFAPGEVVPTTELLVSHLHPEDRDRVSEQLQRCAGDGVAFASQCRIVHGDRRERWVTLIGEGVRDGERVTTVRGFAVDLTAEQRRAVAERVGDQLARATEAHATIDQAKGALMLVYGMDDDTAFELLRWYSKQTNTKLRTIADRIVQATANGLTVSEDARSTLDDLLYDVSMTGAEPTTGMLGKAEMLGEQPRPPYALHVEQLEVHDIHVLRVSGDIDLASAPSFDEALSELLDSAAPPRPVVVDLSAVVHVGQAGFAALESWRRRCAAAGAPLRVVLDESTLDDVTADVTGLDAHPDVESALNA